MKVGVLSDTHDLLRPEVIGTLQGCDCILHAGDISSAEILDRLRQIAPVKAVRGNNDKDRALPCFLDFVIGNRRVFMTHKKKNLPEDLSPYQIVVCGHTHLYLSEVIQTAKKETAEALFLNPGSCGPRRLNQPITMAILSIDRNGIKAERIDLLKREVIPDTNAGPDLKFIETVIRETEKGHNTEDTAKKYHLDPHIAEQIARLYVTHPGISALGILTKMDIQAADRRFSMLQKKQGE